jgi:NADH:ubiquinone oxidoreductase subunit K
MYLGLILSFIFVSLAFNDPKGQIYALLLVILAASESAIGLGILIVLYSYGRSISFKDYKEING